MSMTPGSPPVPPLPAIQEEDEANISQSPVMIPGPQAYYCDQPCHSIHCPLSLIGSDNLTRTSELGLLNAPRGFQGYGERFSVIQKESLENMPSQRTLKTMTSSTPQVHRQPSIHNVSHLWHTPVTDVHDIYPSIQNHLQCQSHHLPCPFPMPTSQSPCLIHRRCKQWIIIIVPTHQTKRTTAVVLHWGTIQELLMPEGQEVFLHGTLYLIPMSILP